MVVEFYTLTFWDSLKEVEDTHTFSSESLQLRNESNN